MRTIHEIMRAVIADYEEMTVEDIKRGPRNAELSEARRRICALAYTEGHKTGKIARVINKDHSTVRHHLKKAGIVTDQLPDKFKVKQIDVDREDNIYAVTEDGRVLVCPAAGRRWIDISPNEININAG